MSRLVEMLTSVKWLWVIVNLFCTVVLAIQLANILEGYIKPSLTRTWEEELMLRDIDFPVIVKICVIPGFKEKALQEAGYQDTWFYFLGQSMFDNTTYGWAGHVNQSETVEEVLAQVSDYDIENILEGIYVWQGGTCCASARAALTERSGSSTKGRTPNIRYFVAKPSIVAIYALFERLSQGFQ